MIKKIIGVASAVAFMLPVAAFASTNIQNLSFDGASNITGGKGDSTTATLSVDLTGDSDVESVSYDYLGDSLDRVCVNVDDQIQTGFRTFDLDMNLPQNTGNWDVTVKTYGFDNAPADQDCQGTSTDSKTFNDQITVLDDASTGNGNSGSTGNRLDALSALVAKLADAVGKILSGGTTTPAPTGVCSAYSQAAVGTVPNAYNPANVRLQGFLLSQGASIPALAAGASFGFYGNQTTAAVGWFQNLNHCQ